MKKLKYDYSLPALYGKGRIKYRCYSALYHKGIKTLNEFIDAVNNNIDLGISMKDYAALISIIEDMKNKEELYG